MRRRNFIKGIGATVGLGTVIPGAPFLSRQLLASVPYTGEKIFVLIQLIGGNDGLNSVIPLDHYDNLINLRPNVAIGEKKILKATDTIGFHPSMAPLKELFEEGRMGLIQNVGYELQNRSHFRSMDIWNSASPYDQMWTSGWLGRCLDEQHPDYPFNYPSQKFTDPLAISVGTSVADVCQGSSMNYSYALDNLSSIREINRGEAEMQEAITAQANELGFLDSTISLANTYTKRVEKAAGKGANLFKYPDGNTLAQQLKMVARLISGGLKTQLYVLTLGGFDTHAYQTMGDTSQGHHASLLKTLSDGIYSFQNDLKRLNLENRVFGMTYSEFGRQIKSNSANGTDHGDAGPIIMFGASLAEPIIGKNQPLQIEMPDQAGVPVEFDFRDVYASLLMDWFGSSESNVNDIFKKKVKHVNFVRY